MSENLKAQKPLERPRNPFAAAIGRSVAALRHSVGLRAASVVNEDRELAPEEIDALVAEFRRNFDANNKAHPELHPSIKWEDVEAAIRKNTGLLPRLKKMMTAGGQVDVIADTGDRFELGETILIMPKSRVGMPYDRWVTESASPGTYNEGTPNAVDFAAARGAKLMTKAQWLKLRQSVPVDEATPIQEKQPYCDGFQYVTPRPVYKGHEIMLGMPAEARAADKDKPYGGFIPTAEGCGGHLNIGSCAACVAGGCRAFRMVMELPK